MFQLVGSEWLKNYYLKSLNNFIIAVVFVGVAFEKKGFDTFNSHVNCWKFYFLNHFEILPCIETVDS